MKVSHVIPATALCLALVPMGAYAQEPQDALEVAAETVQLNHMPDLNPGKPTNPEQPTNPSDKVHQETLNYYINLAGDVLDSKESASHYAASDFTGALTDTKEVDGSLETMVTQEGSHTIINDRYDAIVGEDSEDYVNADSSIRDILAGHGVLPSDDEILAEVKRQIEAGATIKDISGETVSSSLVSTDYFQVYWYVLKEGSDEWHVDGILKKLEQPKVQTYTVNYEWDNAPEFAELPKTVIYQEGDTCVVDTMYYEGYEEIAAEGKDEGGYWTFSGWDKSGSFEVTEDTTIHGAWTYHAPEPVDPVIPIDPVNPEPEPEPSVPTDPVEKTYEVSYAWEGAAPEGIELPESKEYKEGETCKVAELAKTTIETDDGIWIFKGWDKTGEFEVVEDTLIIGTWEFEKKEITPEPENPDTPVVPEPENPDTPVVPEPENPDVPETPDTPEGVVDEEPAIENQEEEAVHQLTSSENRLPQTGDVAFVVAVAGFVVAMIVAIGARVLSYRKWEI